VVASSPITAHGAGVQDAPHAARPMPSFLIEPPEPRLLLSGTPTPQIEAPIVPQAETTVQIVTPTPSSQGVATNSPVSVRVDYSTVNPVDDTLPGLFLKLHFNSSQLQPGADLITNLLQTFLETPDESIVPENDTADLDGDASTDKLLSFGWIDLLDDQWPNVPGPVELFTANFTTTANFTGTQINFSGISSTSQPLHTAPATINAILPLQVTSTQATPSVVTVNFNQPIDRADLNLYDIATGLLGPADVTVSGATTGAVRGSVVISADGRSLQFIATGGVLRRIPIH
jgi:hypothetical protein